MKNLAFRSFLAELEDIGRACMRGARTAVRTIARQPWPVLLLAAILLACAITIVPLALMLFVGFMLIKYATLALFSKRPRRIRE